MRPVEFGEAVPAATRLTLFSADQSDRLFTVITFLMNKVSGVALDLEIDVPCYQVEGEEAEFIYCFTTRSKKKMKAAGAFEREERANNHQSKIQLSLVRGAEAAQGQNGINGDSP